MGYECDPHQRWADEGWGDVPEHPTCGDCCYFEPSPFLNDLGGVCILATEVTSNRIHVEWRRETDSCWEFLE